MLPYSLDKVRRHTNIDGSISRACQNIYSRLPYQYSTFLASGLRRNDEVEYIHIQRNYLFSNAAASFAQ
jgi:hypothetical protein